MHAKRKSRARRGVKVGVLLLAAICAAAFVTHYLISRPRVATFAGITKGLALLKQSPGYLQGARALIDAQKGAAPAGGSVGAFCIGLHQRVDFVSTFSAQQFDLMRQQGGLSFTSLTDSQKALLHETGAFGYASARAGVSDSDLPRARLAVMYQPPDYYLRWTFTRPDGSGCETETGLVDMSEDLKRTEATGG